MRSLIPIPETAREIHGRIVDTLEDLLRCADHRHTDNSFIKRHCAFLELADAYQHAVLASYERPVTCRAGCPHCCFHWVEDVRSFEVEIIVDRLRHDHATEIPRIVSHLTGDAAIMTDLDARVRERLSSGGAEVDGIDTTDLALSCFYQQRRPCPLLTAGGRCMVYDIRPLTCRIYLSFGPPRACAPEHINEEEVNTYLLDFEDEAGELLDKLHTRFDRFGGDTALRSMLLKRLTSSVSAPSRE